MWRAISPHVDFQNKVVLDLGAGYGQFSESVKAHGGLCISVDKINHPELQNLEHFILSDLNNWVKPGGIPTSVPLDPDIIGCFAVLPYLRNPQATLRLFHSMAPHTLIECQYNGDGPGFSFINNDVDMENWFERVGWAGITKLGETHVLDRNMYRSIWLLER